MNDLSPSVHGQSEAESAKPQGDETVSRAESFDPHGTAPSARVDSQPTGPVERIGRYRFERLLGQGGFGRVWLGVDEELRRKVAIKVPTPQRFQTPEVAELYMAEARTVATLDHPHIVPVYDVGRSEDGGVYVVSKFIEGRNLAEQIKAQRPSYAAAAQILATVADALHFAHKQGVVHRDVKPANILIDLAGRPFVTDFGLALKETEFGSGPGLLGTPAYMSPEQARGEGHLVDGRSDIFSMGVILYELLTNRRPFHGDTDAELLERISTLEARPPRQVDDAIPPELERISLNALEARHRSLHHCAGSRRRPETFSESEASVDGTHCGAKPRNGSNP